MKAFDTQTTVIKLRDVLNFINRKLDVCALALAIGICFALHSGSTTFAGNDLVFRHADLSTP